MSASVSEREIRVYCPTHKTIFVAVAAGTIVCRGGGHALSQSFLAAEFWEHCCDCQSFWPSEIAKEGKGRDQCPACDRVTVRRFLCDRCKLISIESDEASRRKSHTILPSGGVSPSCPGCLSPAGSPLLAHQCAEVPLGFTTARAACPFCEEPLAAPVSFPVSVAAYLDAPPSGRVNAAFDARRNLLVASAEGEFVLAPKGKGVSVAVPRMASFRQGQDYYPYEKFYHCADAGAGEVWVLEPAVVESAEGGWRLTNVGRLEVKPDPAAQRASAAAAAREAAAGEFLVCPRCGSKRLPADHFCGGCGYSYPQTAPAASEATPTPKPALRVNAADDLLYTQETIVPSEVAAPRPRRTGLIIGVLAVAAVGLIVLVLALNAPPSVERKLEAAISRGNLLSPPGDSAYSYYQQLKSSGASRQTLGRFEERLWPLITNGPKQMLVEFAKPGTPEPSVSEWQEATQLLSWAGEMRPGDGSVAARASYCQGRIAYLADRKEDAMREWKKALDLDKSWAVAANGVGLLYNERREYNTARPHLTEATQRDPNWAVPYNNLGTSFYYQKRYDEAEPFYRKAVELAPNWARPHAWLGDIAKLRRDYARAIEEYEAVLSSSAVGTSNMDLPTIRRRLDEVRQLAAQDDDEE